MGEVEAQYQVDWWLFYERFVAGAGRTGAHVRPRVGIGAGW
jgi:hypothetical protein